MLTTAGCSLCQTSSLGSSAGITLLAKSQDVRICRPFGRLKGSCLASDFRKATSDTAEYSVAESTFTSPAPLSVNTVPPSQNSMFTLTLDQSTSSIIASDGTVIISNIAEGISASQYRHASTQQQLHSNSPGAVGSSAAVSSNDSSSYLVLDISSSSSPTAAAAVALGEVRGTAFLACARIKLCWMAPHHSTSVAGLPRHIQFLLVQIRAGGPYAIILPLLPQNWKATLQPHSVQPSSNNMLAVHLDSGNPSITGNTWQHAVLVAAGQDPFVLMDNAVAAAAAISGGGRPRWHKQYPDICNYLGWCTWDAFYHDVSAQGIVKGLQSFKDDGLQPRWMIIDDGWQRTALDNAVPKQQQQQQEQQQQPPSSSSSPSTAATAAAATSASSSGWRSSWLMQRLRKLCHTVEKVLLRSVSAIADKLNWWSLLLAGLRQPLLSGVLVKLLKAFNSVTSEHSKRLLSNEFNAKFSDLTSGATADTSSTATAAAVAAVIAAIKRDYCIKYVYAWHAILGYWSGVHPAAVAAAAAGLEGVQQQQQQQGGPSSSSSSSSMLSSVMFPHVSESMSDLEPPCNWSQLVLAGIGVPSEPHIFFTQLHSYLAALGISGVKVDVQNQTELLAAAAATTTAAAAAASTDTAATATAAAGEGVLAAAAAAWHAALECSVQQHFPGNHLINCMCHNTNNFYRTSMSVIARVSDDFYPRLPASHTFHVAACAYNSCCMSPVVLPDWDMFHSKHNRSLLHATARMISGGPVYVSDKPGRHDAQLLSRLALPGGLLLPPLLPGRPTRDCLFVDPCCDGASALKVWNMNRCGGVIAVFNLQGSSWDRSHLKFITHNAHPAPVITIVRPADVEHIQTFLRSSSSSSSSSGNGSKGSSSSSSTQLPASFGSASNGITASSELQITDAFALYQDSSRSVIVMDGLDQGLDLTLAAAASEVITVAPVISVRTTVSDTISSSADDQPAATGGQAAAAAAAASSSRNDDHVHIAVIGLINMLNPGGGVRRIEALGTVTDDNQGAAAAADGGGGGGQAATGSSGDGSVERRDSNGSNGSSGSWVVAEGQEGPEQPPMATAAAATAGASANIVAGYEGTSEVDKDAAAGAAIADTPALAAAAGVRIELLGCGQLLLCCSRQPASAKLDGVEVEYKVDETAVCATSASSSSSYKQVLINIPVGDDLAVDEQKAGLKHQITVQF